MLLSVFQSEPSKAVLSSSRQAGFERWVSLVVGAGKGEGC